MARRWLPGIVVLAALLHGAGIALSSLPAQDGLKFLRVARQFQSRPWGEVVRGSDQHPLYPAAVALTEPLVRALLGPGPDAWRIAGQLVSALASLATIFPLCAFTRAVFDDRAALLAALLFVLLPAPAEIGHDTLADPLALLFFTLTLCWAEAALRTRRLAPTLGCGVAAGLGYWTRPETAVVGVVALGCAVASILRRPARERQGADTGPPPALRIGARTPALLAVAFLGLVGLYAVVKGEVSEKLALRIGAGVAAQHHAPRPAALRLPHGLAGPEWDFAPKEESGRTAAVGWLGAAWWVARNWAEGLGGIFALLACWGAWTTPAAGPGRRLAATYLALFPWILVRHTVALHYLSGRHLLTVIVATVPWAAAGTVAAAQRLADTLAWNPARRRRVRVVALAGLAAVCVALQLRPEHASRWGHLAAARWLTEHAQDGDALLDTRGWAAFLSGIRSYDPWHLPQALTDSRLAFVVIGADELRAASRRGASYRALLAHAAEPAAAFPARRGGRGADVLVYRFRPQTSWEGLHP